MCQQTCAGVQEEAIVVCERAGARLRSLSACSGLIEAAVVKRSPLHPGDGGAQHVNACHRTAARLYTGGIKATC